MALISISLMTSHDRQTFHLLTGHLWVIHTFLPIRGILATLRTRVLSGLYTARAPPGPRLPFHPPRASTVGHRFQVHFATFFFPACAAQDKVGNISDVFFDKLWTL